MVQSSASAAPALRRRFARIVPIAFVTYSLAFLDRINFGFGVAGQMGRDLQMSDRDSAAISASFFLGYFLFQIPGASYASKYSAKRLVFWALILWGGFSALTGLVHTVPLLLVVRFLLGAIEGVVMPAMLVYLTHWFTKSERSRANTFLILGNPVTLLWASAISGYLVQAFGWRTMFVMEGLPSIIWAFVWWRTVDDHPREARWLDAADAAGLHEALEREQQALAPVKHYAAAFRDPRVWLLCGQLFFWSVGLYGLVLWLPKILHEASRYGNGLVGLLAAAPYLCGVILMLINSTLADRTGDRRRFVWPFLFMGAAVFFLSYALGAERFWPAYACLVLAGGCIFAGYGPFFAIVPEIIPRNAAGESMALINSCGALGGFAGTFLIGWLNATTGGPTAGFLTLSISLALAGACMLCVRIRRA
ncbi:MAG: MFS transporter [Lacunisphaera sp.]